MEYRVLLLLIIILGAGNINAARSSSRNFKTLKQQQEEKAAAEKAAKEAKAEAAKYPDGGHMREAQEKVTFLGPKKGWGFVKKESIYYSPQGKNMGELSAGTLFKYEDVKSTSRNDMLLSYLRNKSGWHGPYLLPCTEVAAYDGDPETVDIQIVADLRNYFLLKGEYDTYEEELLNREYKKNPHFNEYTRMARLYKESTQKATKMEEDAAKLNGIPKTRALDDLRKYKYSQASLKVSLEQSAAKYKAWKSQHPVDPKKIEDEKLRELKNKLNEAKSKVAELVPPEE